MPTPKDWYAQSERVLDHERKRTPIIERIAKNTFRHIDWCASTGPYMDSGCTCPCPCDMTPPRPEDCPRFTIEAGCSCCGFRTRCRACGEMVDHNDPDHGWSHD